jgi:transposase
MLTMADYHKIRVAVENEEMSQREAARKFGHGRDTIRKVLADSDTQPRYRRKAPSPSSLDPYHHVIDEWIEDEIARHVKRKQRSNALKIHQRLKEEHGYLGSVYPVRRYIRKRGRSLNPQQVFYTLDFKPGEEAQVDWGVADVTFGAQVATVHLFCMRLSYSRATFVRAYPCERLECFLDGHVRAFRHFGGVPKRCAYDNLKSVVIKPGQKQELVLNENFRRLLAHYAFQTRVCNVCSGHEKGRVENLVKLAQRDFLAGAPHFRGLDDLNAHLERCCLDDLKRLAPHSDRTRQALLAEESSALMPLLRGDGPAYTTDSTTPGKDALVQFGCSYYSVPVAEAFTDVMLRGYADRVEIWKTDEMLAVHPRSWEAGKFELDYRHFIPLLEAKPGGLANARAFLGEPWGEDFSRFRTELNYRNPDGGDRDFVELLLLFTKHPEAEVKRAVAECVRLRAWSVPAVESTITYVEPSAPKAMDMSRWPGLSVETDGVRPASEYDAALLAAEPPEPAPGISTDGLSGLSSGLSAERSSEASTGISHDRPSGLPPARSAEVPPEPAVASAAPALDAELTRYDARFGVSEVLFPSTAGRYDLRANWRGGPGA